MAEAVIVSSVRTPVGRGFKGSLRTSRPDDLAALVIKEALARVPGLDLKDIDDVILGCAMPEGEQGMNVARIAALRAGLPVETSAMTVNRFCASGLQAIAQAAERIRSGAAQVIVAGGTESMSMVPMGGNKISPNPWLVDHYPDAYINVGLLAAIALDFALTPLAYRNSLRLRSLAYAIGVIQTLNGLHHIVLSIRGRSVGSVVFDGPAPGVYSSPVLLLASAYLFWSLYKTSPRRTVVPPASTTS